MKIIKEALKLIKKNSKTLIITSIFFIFTFFLIQKQNKTQINNLFRKIEENNEFEISDLINFPLLLHFIQLLFFLIIVFYGVMLPNLI